MYLKDNRKLIFGIILLIIISTGVFFSLKEYNKPLNQNGQDKTNQNKIENFIKKVDLTLYNNNRTIKWNLDTEKLTSIKEGSIYEMDTINFSALEAKNEIYSGQGQRAQYNNEEEILTIIDQIVIKKVELEIKLNKLKWFQKENKISGLDGVKLSSPNFIINADSLESDTDLSKIIFKGNELSKARLEWR
ncbi:MAG: LPS export ABC transporter periplasmic protein LptC [Halanaerobiales bacterium]|nr:LPS export ABC transporter periplasmic protein LptC [Halanaerobiales bacterium]